MTNTYGYNTISVDLDEATTAMIEEIRKEIEAAYGHNCKMSIQPGNAAQQWRITDDTYTTARRLPLRNNGYLGRNKKEALSTLENMLTVLILENRIEELEK